MGKNRIRKSKRFLNWKFQNLNFHTFFIQIIIFNDEEYKQQQLNKQNSVWFRGIGICENQSYEIKLK